MELYNPSVVGHMLNHQDHHLIPRAVPASNVLVAQNIGSLNLMNLENVINFHGAKKISWTPQQRNETKADGSTRNVGAIEGQHVEVFHFGKFLMLI